MYLPYSSSYRTLNATLKQCNGFLHSKSAHLHQRMPNFAILMGSDYVLSTYIFITRVALYDLSREHSVHLLKNTVWHSYLKMLPSNTSVRVWVWTRIFLTFTTGMWSTLVCHHSLINDPTSRVYGIWNQVMTGWSSTLSGNASVDNSKCYNYTMQVVHKTTSPVQKSRLVTQFSGYKANQRHLSIKAT